MSAVGVKGSMMTADTPSLDTNRRNVSHFKKVHVVQYKAQPEEKPEDLTHAEPWSSCQWITTRCASLFTSYKSSTQCHIEEPKRNINSLDTLKLIISSN